MAVLAGAVPCWEEGEVGTTLWGEDKIKKPVPKPCRGLAGGAAEAVEGGC